MRSCKPLLILVLLVYTGCKATAFFGSPNNVLKKEAVINMLDGSQKKGLLTITLETAYYPVEFIKFSYDGKEEEILIDSVQSYSIGNDIFFPKKIILEYNGPQRLLFVKRLTPEKSGIQLYELYQESVQRDDGQNLILYFVSLPAFGRFEAWGLGNNNLVPHFDKKMCLIVGDCPVLANKISSRKPGYYFSQNTLSNLTKLKVLKRIIEEYNSCH